VLRIFPGFWACLLVTAFIIGPIVAFFSNLDLISYFTFDLNADHTNKNPYFYVLNNAFLRMRQYEIMDLLKDNPLPAALNGSLWTLYPEFKSYLVILLCGIFGFFQNRRFLLIPFGFFYLFSLPITSKRISNYISFILEPLGWGYGEDLILALYLLSGILIYGYRQQIFVSRKGLLLAGLIFVFCILLPIYKWVMPFCLGYLLLAASQALPPMCKKIEKFGDISYGIYIYSFPIQQLCTLTGINHLEFIVYFWSTLVLTIPLAIVSWYAVEKTAMKWGQTKKISISLPSFN
jgi:peptidoglycan/LPS O-acetylase OafA/YrhL